MLAPNLIQELQTFLFNFVLNQICITSPQSPINSSSFNANVANIDKYVQRVILQTMAVFYKRSKLDIYSSSRSNQAQPKLTSMNMVEDVIKLFESPNIKLVISNLYII